MYTRAYTRRLSLRRICDPSCPVIAGANRASAISRIKPPHLAHLCTHLYPRQCNDRHDRVLLGALNACITRQAGAAAAKRYMECNCNARRQHFKGRRTHVQSDAHACERPDFPTGSSLCVPYIYNRPAAPTRYAAARFTLFSSFSASLLAARRGVHGKSSAARRGNFKECL